MYEKLKELCKTKGITITNLCIEITGSPGNLSTWKKGNINLTSLTKIADYFNISTDYLLGRTDEPTVKANNNIITTGDITPIASGKNSTSNGIVIDSKSPAKDVAELVDLIQSLPLVKRAEAIIYINNLKNNE